MDLISLRFTGGERQSKRQGGAVVGRMGFRPFFLLAAAFAVGALPLWLLVLRGGVDLATRGGALHWHAHEMLFGYTVAVIAGFLLTAASRWTGRATAVGRPLYVLATLWLAGRFALFFSAHLPASVVAVADLAFLPALAIAVGRPILATKNRRNYAIVVMLGGLGAANLATHLDAIGWAPGASAWGLRLGLNLVTLMMLVIGARVIPMFTRNATGDQRIVSRPRWDKATALLMAGLVISDVLRGPELLGAVLAAAAAVFALVAMSGWGLGRSLKAPMLWVLHLGYAWIVLSLALRGVQLGGGFVTASASIHALTAGAIGTLTLGMMTRVTLGHTGRLIADSPWTTVSFVLVTLAALVRVAVPELGVHVVREAWLVSGLAWALAFVAFLVHFGPMLLTPRADGRSG